jgi:hypothetical protein
VRKTHGKGGEKVVITEMIVKKALITPMISDHDQRKSNVPTFSGF